MAERLTLSRRGFLRFTGAAILNIKDGLHITRDLTSEIPVEEHRSLIEFLVTINNERQFYRSKVEQNDVFKGFKRLAQVGETEKEAVISGFDMYFPIYRAAQEKYLVPWSYLWIMHAHETSVSRSKNPEASGFLGAMQRGYTWYKEDYVSKAIEGYEFLKHLQTRYKKPESRTSDYEEIMFAARKLSLDAAEFRKRNPKMGLEESILAAQFKYCAPIHARERNTHYLQVVKPLFSTPISPTIHGLGSCDTQQPINSTHLFNRNSVAICA